MYFTLIFLYFFNLNFPITELSTPYSVVVCPPGHLSLSSEGGQANTLPESDTPLASEPAL